MKKKLLIALSPIMLSGEVINLQNVTVTSEREDEIGAKESIAISQRPDISEVLSQNLPQITLSRTSGVGNDVILRGQQRDNIAVVIDDSTIYGACPNRMDPAIMHLSSSAIKDIEVKEGVFDVSQFGSLGGTIHVKNREPEDEFRGEVSGTYNSMGSERVSTQIEGGTENISGNIGYSYDRADQYRDGDGNTFAEQVENIVLGDNLPANDGVRYSDPDMDAYTRQNWFGNLVYRIDDKQKVKFGYFGDYAEDVLYPVFSMDAIKDQTDLYTLKYEGSNLGDFSKKLKINLFQSKVSHDMSNRYRESWEAMPRIHKVESIVTGGKVENSFSTDEVSSTFGVDFMEKSWDGNLYNDKSGDFLYSMIPDVVTKDFAVYGDLKLLKEDLEVTFGTRIDFVEIEAEGLDNIHQFAKSFYGENDSQDYGGVSANIFGRYYIGTLSSLFLGLGQSVRFPNGKELYMNKISKNSEGNPQFSIMGNPDLKETKNREVDLGIESRVFGGSFTAKTFYSDLKDFIYAYNMGTGLGFTNIDASIWGFDMKYSREITKNLKSKIGVAYQRGEKKDPIDGQTDRDLAEIPPLKVISNIHYFEKGFYGVKLELIGAGKPHIDSDNGEKEVDGYFVANLKGNYHFSKNLTLNMGVDNIFDETYSLNNSYIGRGVNSTDSDNIFILNEMGRNFFFNLNYFF
jgi:iron complex outermembrane receptor protein